MKLSFLDQSFVRPADGPQIALQETLQMAQLCEQLGYSRFWVSEHHDATILAGSSPEVLLAAIGAATSHIRIGSGGVMLPHYSAYKVAENFSLLGNLYPGRIDLGVGRAPGADMSTAVALATDGRPKFERFPQLVEELGDYLNLGHLRARAKPAIAPKPPGDIPVWILGSSPDSAMLAGKLGLPYNVALFINPQMDGRLIELYRHHFQASEQLEAPYAILSLNTLCAEDESYAAALKKAADVNFIRFITQGGHVDFCGPEEAEQVQFGPQEAAFIANLDGARAVGTPGQVKNQLRDFAAAFGADELMLVSNTYHLKDRQSSLKLVAKAFKMSQSASDTVANTV